MAKLIKQIHDLVDIATDKGLTNYWSRDQVDAAVYSAVCSIYREHLPDFPKTDRSRNYLMPFLKDENITLTAGVGSIPAGFEKEVVFHLNDTDKTPVVIVESAQWNERKRDPVEPPSATNPIGHMYKLTTTGSVKIEVAPTSITTIRTVYMETPTMPNYVTTINGDNQEVYDDTNSVDVQHSELLHDIIVERALRLLGVAVKDAMALSVANGAENKLLKS